MKTPVSGCHRAARLPIEGSDDLSIMTVSVNFEGSFAQFVKFVNLLDRSPRFLIIRRAMQVSPQPKGDVLNANLKLHVFIKDDRSRLCSNSELCSNSPTAAVENRRRTEESSHSRSAPGHWCGDPVFQCV